jgi:hypothetical protein
LFLFDYIDTIQAEMMLAKQPPYRGMMAANPLQSVEISGVCNQTWWIEAVSG